MPAHERVLLVDMDVDSTETLREILTLWRRDVLLAESGRDALHMLGGRAVGAVLLDDWLRDMSVLEFLGHARRVAAPLPPVIVMTCDHRTSEVDSPDVAARLLKPFPLETLQAVLDRFAPLP